MKSIITFVKSEALRLSWIVFLVSGLITTIAAISGIIIDNTGGDMTAALIVTVIFGVIASIAWLRTEVY